jgi:hypothetical protein
MEAANRDSQEAKDDGYTATDLPDSQRRLDTQADCAEHGPCHDLSTIRAWLGPGHCMILDAI